MKSPESARIHLIPAKNVPLTLVLRQKPSKVFHVFLWNTAIDHLEPGSRFAGTLHVEECDLSFDGKWMLYAAIGGDGEAWSGLCQPPYLRTVADGRHAPGIGGGGWVSEKQLCVGNWEIPQGVCPYEVKSFAEHNQVNDDVCHGLGFLQTRLRRDGWKRIPAALETQHIYGRDVVVKDQLTSQPANNLPKLHMIIDADKRKRYTFQLDGYPDLVDEKVSWANWDCNDNLIVARLGVLYRFDFQAIQKKTPTFKLDLENYVKNKK